MEQGSSADEPATVVVSATHSGAGKTTITRALLWALRERGLVVQSFKIGPDFIDPMYHRALTGRASVNLDLWMMGEDGLREVFARWSVGADVVVIEAMGALFDGADGGRVGSAAHVAAVLGVPVVVVVDVWGMTRTAGAVMDGMDGFDPQVEIGGFVLNRVGSRGHRDLIERGIGESRWRRVVAAVEADPALEVPERHLGLLTPYENPADMAGSVARAGKQIDLDRVFGGLAAGGRAGSALPAQAARRPSRARLAVARDAAFCFYYEENLAALVGAGFDLVEFSPVAGEALPDSCDAVYFGGGYPESFAADLAANSRLAGQLRDAAERGMPIYGECGGLVWLGRTLRTHDGVEYPMSGVLPVDITMDPQHLAIRYVELTTGADSLLGRRGTVLRGQEFHQSRITACSIPADFYAVRTSDGQEFEAGFRYRGVVASYMHAYFAGQGSGVAGHFVEAACRWRA
ncbi:Cobyrinic acid A,C-diamide synthase [Propionibacterium freudenreichii]|nr:Cobyrinic Acid a,c-diamide synthase [Propionibacterium freudenreichii]SBN40308.1 Cobyrinic acid A,C-diamide synthase [Propionibacterium freudenreichii]SCQ54826.1 Cobyrinic acid A,C-diamide synthase [Propionibacterium freudenreichii]SCQ57593.1 Cobyrinic acid A,C-diamide synthase [Propionibacterium freudenreichii]SCQ60213.1 Cobyrinic acid A,C-diamide synthase [Propionibacterium freudenreichii]